MTINEFRHVVEMIEECAGTSMAVVKVYEYINRYNDETMYAVFTSACFDDMHSSPAVKSHSLIYENGKWLLNYDYMNEG